MLECLLILQCRCTGVLSLQMLVLHSCQRSPPTCLLALASYPQPFLQPRLVQLNSAAVITGRSNRPVLIAIRSLVTVYPALFCPAWICNAVKVLHSVLRQILPLTLAMSSSKIPFQRCKKKGKGADLGRSSLLLLVQTSQVQVAAMTLAGLAVGHAISSRVHAKRYLLHVHSTDACMKLTSAVTVTDSHHLQHLTHSESDKQPSSKHL